MPGDANVQPAVYRYLDCGIFDQGFARVHSTFQKAKTNPTRPSNCHSTVVLANP